MRKTPYIHYIQIPILPVYVGFTTNKEALAKEAKRLGDGEYFEIRDAPGVTYFFKANNDHYPVIVVYIAKIYRPSDVQTIGLIAHETAHAFDRITHVIDEDIPSEEFKAYTYQYLVSQFYERYKKEWKERK